MREKLFASAALGNRWHCASDKKKVDWFLRVIVSKNQGNRGHGQKIDFAHTLSV